MPRVLGMYRAAPFFRGYAETLGLGARDLVFSPPSRDALWRDGAGHGASDPCYPVKVLLAHVAHLVARGLGRIAAACEHDDVQEPRRTSHRREA